MRRPRPFAGLSLLALCSSMPARAASPPFCLQARGGLLQCIYDDASLCNRDAKLQRATCTVNQATITLPANGLAYCTVDNTRIANCLYGDAHSCQTAAGKHAVCTRRVSDTTGALAQTGFPTR